jgi:hypothetical protein
VSKTRERREGEKKLLCNGIYIWSGKEIKMIQKRMAAVKDGADLVPSLIQRRGNVRLRRI